MSDGYSLWGFKRGNILSYRYNAMDGFTDISTHQLTGFKLDENDNPILTGYNNDGWTSLNEYEIVICEPGVPPVVKDVRELIAGNLTCGDASNSDACDTVVDNRDYEILASAVGTCSGDDGFVERADYDEDGCITKKDVKEWKNYLDEFNKSMLCDDHMNSPMGCCRDGYIYGKYEMLCGATYLPLADSAGVIDPRREVDYFRFYAITGNQYWLATDSPCTDLYLYDTDGITEIGNAAEIVWNCPLSGTYYSKVYSRNSVDYVLSLTVPYYIAVDIDIKPHSDFNFINKNGHGLIPVAILSNPGFDAMQVDPSTVRLNDMGVKSTFHGQLLVRTKDVNRDGIKDMVVWIENRMGAFREGDTEAELLAALFNGDIIRGVDTIRIFGH